MWSLRRALVLVFLVVVTIPLTLFWLWPHSRALQNEVQQVQEKHLLLARNLAAALDRYSRDLLSTFDHVSSSLIAGRPLESTEALLTGLHIRHLCLIDMETGRIIERIAGLNSIASDFISPDRMIRLKALAAERGSLPGGVMASPGDGAPVIPIVRVWKGKMVLATIETHYFRELAGSISFGQRGHAVITDHEGRILAHPLPELERQMTDISSIPTVLRTMRWESGIDVFYSDAFKDDMVAGFTVVPSAGWGVLVPQPVSELRETAKRINAGAATIFTMGMILAALFALRFSLLVLRPLHAVMQGAARMAKNEQGVQINLTSRLVPREFSRLADTFNEMARNISIAQQQEADARDRAESANKQKSEFVRYITHELRSPVAAILGFSRVLSQEAGKAPGTPQSREQISHIQDAATHLLSLINDLLDLGKMEAGQYRLDEEPLGVDEIVSRCINMLGETARAREITLTATMEGETPEIIADERAMYQVLLNLVSNAVRYGRKGGSIEVSAGVREDDSIEIIVADDGPGISPQDLERVMKPFERIERNSASGVQGTGLGLPIVKHLVELHGGRFRLTSAIGAGTVAYVELPAARNLHRGTSREDMAAAA
jgi:signal transduction histidine kinase